MDLNHSFKSCQRREDGCDESKNIRLEPVAKRANANRPYGILDEIKSVPCNKFPKNKILIYNPWNPVNPLNQWFKLIITENIPPKQTSPQIFEWKLRAQQPLVWITNLRDFRISLFNHNAFGLRGKFIIMWCFLFLASRRCVNASSFSRQLKSRLFLDKFKSNN